MADCPKCGNELIYGRPCYCGWQPKAKPEPSGSGHQTARVPRVKCCRCSDEAYFKIQTPTGWENVCQTDYNKHFDQEVKKTCQNMGLDTTAKRRDYVRNALKNFGRNMRQREPGDDDEVIA